SRYHRRSQSWWIGGPVFPQTPGCGACSERRVPCHSLPALQPAAIRLDHVSMVSLCSCLCRLLHRHVLVAFLVGRIPPIVSALECRRCVHWVGGRRRRLICNIQNRSANCFEFG